MKTIDKEITMMERRIRFHYALKYGTIYLVLILISLAYYVYMTNPSDTVLAKEARQKSAITIDIDKMSVKQKLLDRETPLEPAGNAKIMQPEIKESKPTVQPISTRYDSPVNLYVQCMKLNIRSGCSEDYPVVDTVEYGTNIEATGYVINDEGDRWITIMGDQGIKYVKSDYVSKDNPLRYIGDFYITYYCGCEICCDVAGRETASGKMPVAGRTVAADTFLPFGTKLMIDGNMYTVEDRGGLVKGNHIDIYCNSHEEALSHRTKTIPIWMAVDSSESVRYY